jgi:ATP-dependent helicase HrpB
MLYDALVLDESRGHGDPDEVGRVLASAALEKGPSAFAPPEGALDRWLARARFAAEQDPELGAPSDAEVHDELKRACAGLASFAELRQVSLLDLVKARAGHAQCARIDALAPERMTLASGRVAKIEYEAGKPPWLESYLQDFFGMKETPRAGRTSIVLHLLAPNRRAVQVTSDLPGFWVRHYAQIRRELARKYPKHAWPEDPSRAVPMKRRG